MPMPTILDLRAPATWPDNIRTYLKAKHDLFLGRETGQEAISGALYDDAIYKLTDLLTQYAVIGWHCTRLTESEVEKILQSGMQLPNAAMLESRLEAACVAGLLTEKLKDRLKENHWAGDENRAGRIWFTFFPPRDAGGGINDFLESWGGEALCICHERDPETAPVLKGIGIPCVIEAVVPLSLMETLGWLPDKVARTYLMHSGYRTREPVDHEGYINAPLPAENILHIWRFPSEQFTQLTGWSPLL